VNTSIHTNNKMDNKKNVSRNFIFVYINMIEFQFIVFFVLFLIFSISFTYTKQVELYTDKKQNNCKKPVLEKKHFDVYLINLDRNKDRLQNFIEQWIKTDMQNKTFKRIPAVDGSKLNLSTYVSKRAYREINEIEMNGYRTKHYQLTPGGVGCYLSHLNAYKLISESKNDYGLIFEDDVSIPKNFYEKFNNILKDVPNDWDILLLSCHCIKCKRQEIYSDVNKFIWLHCYLVRKESAKKLVDYLSRKYIEQQIDSELSDIAMKEDWLKIYCLNSSLSTQTNVFITEIQKPMKYSTNIDPYSSVDPKGV